MIIWGVISASMVSVFSLRNYILRPFEGTFLMLSNLSFIGIYEDQTYQVDIQTKWPINKKGFKQAKCRYRLSKAVLAIWMVKKNVCRWNCSSSCRTGLSKMNLKLPRRQIHRRWSFLWTINYGWFVVLIRGPDSRSWFAVLIRGPDSWSWNKDGLGSKVVKPFLILFLDDSRHT